MMKFVKAFLFSLLLTSGAFAQGAGQLQSGQIWGNPKATQAPATGTTVGAVLDRQLTCSSQGDIIFRGSAAWSCLAPGLANAPLLSKGSAANLAYSTISYPTSANSGGVACFSSTTAMISSVAETANAIMLGGGAGACPTPLASLGTTTTVLHGNASGAPTFGSVAYADIATAAIATTSQYLAGTSSELVQSGVIYTAETTTTFGATTTFDFSTFINTAVTLTANITTQTLTNVKAGQAGQIRLIQDGTGSHTTVWNSIFKFSGGATPVLTTTANAVDALEYNCVSSTYCVASMIPNVK